MPVILLIKYCFFTFKPITSKYQKKFSKEVSSLVGISVYFFLMNPLGFANVFYLRLLNVLIVFYAMNKTIQRNVAEGKKIDLCSVSAMKKSLVGVFLSTIGLIL